MKKIVLISLVFLLVACAGIRSRYHRVEAGDSLPMIAAKYDVSVEDLRERNHSQLVHGLVPGSKIYIPHEEGKAWDSELVEGYRAVSSVSPTYDVTPIKFSWPVNGFISSGFGRRRHRGMHEGIDIVAREGTTVKASRSGMVIYRDNKIPGYGNLIIVHHSDTFYTVYAHLSKYEVRKGQFVARGQRIGRVGHTGRATSSHLHFEIRNRRRPVNPLLYLQGQYAANILHR